MRLEDFDYHLPDERIAQTPVEPRDSARLLVDRGSADPEHRYVHELDQLLCPGDLLVVNDSRVIPARLKLRRASGGAAEVLLLEPLEPARRHWEALLRPGAKLRVGERLHAVDGTAIVEVGARRPAGDTFEVSIVGEGDPLDLLAHVGEMPLPPYISTPLPADRRERYQTVYAAEPGSAAAPTAGLHLTPSLLERLATHDVGLARVELVVGLDTFQPVSAADPRQHRIHSERYAVHPEVLERCRAARRVVAVGTTSVRALESAATLGQLEGRTELFIHRPYDWQLVDVLMTNFHLPRTTLLLMIDAFVGDRWRRLYTDAMEQGYRFLSFGDAMLLDRHLT
ncbi:MAG: tRNA preQ1(34) S-adenosylmethionine ribosyltransferase-isomerase QueA [Acidimicrobiales bacterium]|nr:tRNA preQ1(34) S-adenosylmethionine ribosyltransferase-isomerase QueA [Acidimicrobiales bacterium]MCB9394501.1 tRNA preQ1(34) S-adenosylmethionine ribosyltransferase-isomerase QueA [Acidimicrobiaceae bacterium]